MTTLWNFLKELLVRISLSSPKFFVILQWIFGILGTLSWAGVIVLNVVAPDVCGIVWAMDWTLCPTLWEFAVVVSLIFGFSWLPVEDSNKLESKLK